MYQSPDYSMESIYRLSAKKQYYFIVGVIEITETHPVSVHPGEHIQTGRDPKPSAGLVQDQPRVTRLNRSIGGRTHALLESCDLFS
jgi:hypothetical protein